MPLCNVHWRSEILGKQVATDIILPVHGQPPFLTFYLLHGLSDDHTGWRRHTRIEWYARNWPIMIVMPDGFRGFYTDNAAGPAYAKYLGEELPAFIERHFAGGSERHHRAIGGLSMGGYGALRLGLGYPEKFNSINSHSGALMSGTRRPTRFPDWELNAWFGKRPAGTRHDLLKLARDADAAGTLPKIRIDCGTEDFLFDDNREFHAKLKGLRVEHEYEEFPGAHDWNYWDTHIQEAIAFHAAAAGIEKAS